MLGLNATPNSTDTTSVPNLTLQKWLNPCGFTVLEAHTQANGGHTTPIDANSVIGFFGLDKTSAVDPEVAMCSGTGGSGGAGGSGGGGSGSGGTSIGGSAVGGASSLGGGNNASGSGAGAGSSFGGGASNGGTVGSGGGQTSAGAPGTSGSSFAGATSGSNGDAPTGDNSAGCSCDVVGGRNSTGAFGALALAVLGTLGRRKRRQSLLTDQ